MTVSMRPRGAAAEGVPPLRVEALVGAWLFVSAFVWPRSHARATNAWVCGVLGVALAVVAVGLPRARPLSAALAVWLFVSAWALPVQPVAALWNDVICSIAIFAVSLAPSATRSRPGRLGSRSRST